MKRMKRSQMGRKTVSLALCFSMLLANASPLRAGEEIFFEEEIFSDEVSAEDELQPGLNFTEEDVLLEEAASPYAAQQPEVESLDEWYGDPSAAEDIDSLFEEIIEEDEADWEDSDEKMAAGALVSRDDGDDSAGGEAAADSAFDFTADEVYAIGTLQGVVYYGYRDYSYRDIKVKINRETGVILAVEDSGDADVLWLPSEIRQEDGEAIPVKGVAAGALRDVHVWRLYVPVSLEAEAFDLRAFEGTDPDRTYPEFCGAANEKWSALAEQFGQTYIPCLIDPDSDGLTQGQTIGGETADLNLYCEISWDCELTVTLTGRNGEGTYRLVTPAGSERYNNKSLCLELGAERVPDGDYDVQIENKDYGISADFWCHVDRTAPGAPEQLKAQQEGSDLLLTWAAGREADILDYRLYILDGSGAPYADWTLEANQTSYLFTDAMPGETYTFRVSARDQFYQEGEWSEVTATAAEDVIPPEIIQDLPEDITRIGGEYSFYVDAKDDKGINTEGYRLQWLREGEWAELSLIQPRYYYGNIWFDFDIADPFFDGMDSIGLRLAVTDIYGNTAYGAERTYQLDRTGPEKVKNLHADESEYPSSVLILNWDEVADDDFSYFLLEEETEDEEGNPAWTEVRRTWSERGARLWGLAPESVHRYRVCAYDEFGNQGESSDVLEVTMPSDVSSPAIYRISPDSGSRIDRSADVLNLGFEVWDDSDVASLLVQVSTDEGEEKNWTDVGTATEAFTSRQDREEHTWWISWEMDVTGMQEGMLYVRAIPSDASGNAGDQSGAALVASYIIDRTPPAAPANLRAEEKDGTVCLSWDKGEEDLSYYYIFRDHERSDLQSGTTVYSVTEEDGRISWTEEISAYMGETFRYEVKAYDLAGNEGETAKVEITLSGDTEKPEVTAFYPEEDERILQNTKVWVGCEDNGQLETLYVRWSTDGGETWSEEEEQSLLDYRGYGPQSTGHEFDPVSTLPLTEDTETLTVQAWCKDTAGNVSETAEHTWMVDLIGPEINDFSVSLHGGYPTLTWKANEEVTEWRIQRKRSDESYFSNFIAVSNYHVDQYFTEENGYYSWIDESVSENWRYVWRLQAMDRDGNVSLTANAGAFIYSGSLEDQTAPTAVISGNVIGVTGKEMAFSGERSVDDRGITSWNWDFGDGSTSNLAAPFHTYTESGSYTVTLTAADRAGNIGTAWKDITVLDPETVGSVTIHVMEKGGGAVPDAGVYFRLGSEDMTVLHTDENGTAVLQAQAGSYLVGVYANGYLPVSEEVRFIDNAQLSLTVELTKQELVTGALTVKKMTLEEIKAAGIDVNSPANQNVTDFAVRLTYRGVSQTVHTYVRADGSRAGGGSASFGGREYYVYPIGYGGGSGSFNWADHADRLGSDPPYAVIDIPGKASWLKDFFDVNLTVVNNASAPFSLDEALATLKVPDGLTLVDTNRTDADAMVSMGTIAGGGTASAEWILRGDKPGSYDLQAEFSATLHDFNEPVTAVFKTDQPVVVSDGKDIYIDVLTERNVEAGERPVVRIGIRTEGDEPLNCPHISLDKATLVRTFVTENLAVVDQNPEVLTKGQELWADYIITQESFEKLQAYRESYWGQFSSHLTGQTLQDAFRLDLQGLEVNFTFDVVENHTIAATRIELFQVDESGMVEDLPITYYTMAEGIDTLIGQKLPSLLVHTSFIAPNGQAVSGPTPLFIRDDYLTSEDDIYGTEAMLSVTTDDYGDYLYKGYEIAHTAWVQSSPLGGGQALADEFDITRYESSDHYEISFASWRDEVEFLVSVHRQKEETDTYPELNTLTLLAMSKMAYENLDRIPNVYQPGPNAKPLTAKTAAEICHPFFDRSTAWTKLNESKKAAGLSELDWGDVMKQCLVGWSIVDTFRDDKSGFFAATFFNGKDVVIAYRGSDELALENWNDWVENDLTFALLQKVTPQMDIALAYAMDIQEEFGSGNTLTATGHSLGGGLGILAANGLNIRAVTFDSGPTLRTSYYGMPGFMGQAFHGIDKWTYRDYINFDCPVGGVEKDSKNYTAVYTLNTDRGPVGLWNHDPSNLIDYNPVDRRFQMASYHSSNTFLVGGRWQYDMDGLQLREILNQHADLYGTIGDATGNWKYVAVPAAWTLLEGIKLVETAVDELRKVSLQLGTSGDNTLRGSARKAAGIPYSDLPDIIYGGDGNDTILATGNNDVLIGGRGDDHLDGGTGDDAYYYNKGDGLDTIVDVEGNDVLFLRGFSSGDRIEHYRTASGIVVECNNREIIRISPKRSWLGAAKGSMEIVIYNENGTIARRDKITDWDTQYCKAVTVACPVDVNIYDPQGNLIRTIRDGEELAAYEDYGVLYCHKVDNSGDYVKELFLEEGYRVEAVGNDEGTMYVSVREASGDGGSSAAYEAVDVPVEKGQIFTLNEEKQEITSVTADGETRSIPMTVKEEDKQPETETETEKNSETEKETDTEKKPETEKSTEKPKQPLSIAGLTFQTIADQVYTGKAVCPAVTVKNGSAKLREGTDFTVTYANNVLPDTVKNKKASVTVKGIGNYTGTKTLNFKIYEKTHSYDAWKQDRTATVFEPAREVRTCSVCKEKTYRTVGKALTSVLKTNASSLLLKVKQSTAKFTVTMAAGDSVKTWTSGNSSILTVKGKSNGTCTLTAGKKAGTTTLKIVLASGKSVTIPVKVQKKAVKTTKIGNVPGAVTLQAGKKLTLSPVLSPITSVEKIKYSSSNKKVAAVSSKGVITANKAGTAKIKIKAGKKTFTVKVTVPKTAVTSLKGVPAALTLKKGKTSKLKVTTLPAGSDGKVSYNSSNKAVATVTSKGVLKAKAAGTSVITVSCGKVKKTFVVTVK